MRILVVSDTHGDVRPLRPALAASGPFAALLHAGDFITDLGPCAALAGVAATHCHAVAGNCDYPLEQPAEAVVELGGVRILLTHGHHYGVKRDYSRLYYRAAELQCQAAVFGHSHVPVCLAEGGILLFNPGSPGAPRRPGAPGSYGILTVSAGRITGELCWLLRR